MMRSFKFDLLAVYSFIFEKFGLLLIHELIYHPQYTEYLLYALCGLFLLVQLFYLLYYHRRLMTYKVEPLAAEPIVPPISVIISARNEAKNLTEFLPQILEQEYINFEVVVVNDCSYDQSELLLQDMQKKYPHLKIVTVTEHPRFKTGKKFALTMGIKAAAHEHLLFTDADCAPASNQWVAGMASKFAGNDQAQIVLGYSPYLKESGFINAFTRFETLKTGMNYLSASLAGNPYMGIGRNLAYTKTLFFSNKGFASHMHILAGDDDLFVNQHATTKNTLVQINPETFTFSRTKNTFGSYFKQKKRHMGVGKFYRNSHRRLLSFDAMSGFLFYVLLIICLILRLNYAVIAGLYFFRLILQLVIYQNVFKKLKGNDLLWLLPFFDLIYYVYLNVFGLVGTFIKTKQWK
jgi:biofilm PGA synthesis N-glycosyltransferase PgaC